MFILRMFRSFRKPVTSDVQVVRTSVAAATQATKISKTHKEKKKSPDVHCL